MRGAGACRPPALPDVSRLESEPEVTIEFLKVLFWNHACSMETLKDLFSTPRIRVQEFPFYTMFLQVYQKSELMGNKCPQLKLGADALLTVDFWNLGTWNPGTGTWGQTGRSLCPFSALEKATPNAIAIFTS